MPSRKFMPDLEILSARKVPSGIDPLAPATASVGIPPAAVPDQPPPLPPLVGDPGNLVVTWSLPNSTIITYTNPVTGTSGTQTPDVVVVTNWSSNILQITPTSTSPIGPKEGGPP